jgi:carbon storage regulator CsrA
MLFITRKKNESLVIDNHITVTVADIRGEKVRLSITPTNVAAYRQEDYEAIHGRWGAKVDARQWRTSMDVTLMLQLLKARGGVSDRLSDRKWRLARAAAYRQNWDEDNRQTVELIETLADSPGRDAEASIPTDAALDLIWRASCAGGTSLQPKLCDLFRCIFDDVSLSGDMPAAWLTDNVRALARAADEARTLPEGLLENARLAVLSDGLEEAGCTDVEVLQHLRSAGPHVRGCWALDVVLGKE